MDQDRKSMDVGGIDKTFVADVAVAAMKRSGATAGVVARSERMNTFGDSASTARRCVDIADRQMKRFQRRTTMKDISDGMGWVPQAGM